MSLSDRQIKNAKSLEKPYKIADAGGLFLLVKPSGKKFWHLKYRFLGKEKLLSFGEYPIISLSEARIKRDEAKKLIASDEDPSQVKKELKAQKKVAMLNSFESLAREWHKNNSLRWTPKHAARILTSLETDVFPKIGQHPITEIKAPLLLETVRAVEARGVSDTASRILQRIKSVFNYAVQTGKAEDNPTFALTGVVITERVNHQPALPQSELVEFYRRLLLEPMREENRIAMLLIILTFVRSGSLRLAQWCEIDFEKKEWAIPAEKMKMRAPHIVPLSDWSLELLQTLHKITGSSEYLFPNYRDVKKPISENMLSYAMGRMGYKGIATPHGFRSLATDVLNENSFPTDVIERQLAHVERNTVRAAYHRTEYLPQRHEMMHWYSDWLKEKYLIAITQKENSRSKT